MKFKSTKNLSFYNVTMETWNLKYILFCSVAVKLLLSQSQQRKSRLQDGLTVGKHFENYGTFFWNAIWKQRRGGQRRNWSENNLHFQSREPRGVQQVHQAWGALGRGAKLWPCGAFRHEICSKFHTAGISGQNFYTLNFTEIRQFWW